MSYKNDFPIFAQNPSLIYLDSGASAQKPKYVLDSVHEYSQKFYANIHRGLYSLSLISTEKVENIRDKTAKFLGAAPHQLIFTKNGTEASNILVNGFSEIFLEENDEIIIAVSEHHANFLPWQIACAKKNAHFIVIHPDSNGVFCAEDFTSKFSSKTKAVVFAHVSNVTGQIFPIQKIVEAAKKYNIFTVLDACQSVPHLPFDFTALGIDAAFFTGHKFGAGGTGGLLLSERLIGKFPPLLWGGDIVEDVTENSYTLLPAPAYFESGTPPIENIIGLGAAIEYIENIGGMEKIRKHEFEILEYGLEKIKENLPHWKLVGPNSAEIRSGNISLYHPTIHHLDIGMMLADKNIAVRTGFHCANPLHHFLQCAGTVRASIWIYTTKEDIDAFIQALIEIENIF